MSNTAVATDQQTRDSLEAAWKMSQAAGKPARGRRSVPSYESMKPVRILPEVIPEKSDQSRLSQTSVQTSRAGTVGNAESSQSSQTLPVFSENEYIYTAEPAGDMAVDGIEWLQKPRYGRQTLTIMAGRRRSGKSTMCLYDCAVLSQLGFRVLIIQREDPKGIVVARLQLMGADMNNIALFTKRAKRRGSLAEVQFDGKDLDAIINVAEDYGADLVYIDPLHALSKGRQNDQQSADCLVDLLALAQRINCCILGVMHTHKNPTNVEDAVSGSEQWVAKARSYMLLDSFPDDPDHSVLQQVDASYTETENLLVTWKKTTIKDAKGNEVPTRIVSGVESTDDTVQDIFNVKHGIAEDPVDPVEKSEIAIWLYDIIKDKGGHVYAQDLFDWGKTHNPPYTSGRIRQSYHAASVGQTKQSCARPRSILYLTDQCTEQQAKDWGTPGETVKSENSAKSKQSQGTPPAKSGRKSEKSDTQPATQGKEPS